MPPGGRDFYRDRTETGDPAGTLARIEAADRSSRRQPERRDAAGSTYFDTPDGVLAWQNLTLRVREEAGRFIQTVKSGGGSKGAALVRGEWEDPISGGWPDPAAPQTGRFIPAANQLIGLVRTEIARRTVILCPNSETRVEVAIDLGHVAALHHNACEPVCEIELELKGGSMTLLYDLALEMLAVAPMRLEHCSKSVRGFRLAALSAEPETVAPVHASEVVLNRV